MKMKTKCGVLLAALLLAGCSKAPQAEGRKYASAAEAAQALNAENAAIDRLIGQLAKADSDAERKKLSCVQIPQQYDRMLGVLEANQQLMTEADRKVQDAFRQLALQQKARFAGNLLCRS